MKESGGWTQRKAKKNYRTERCSLRPGSFVGWGACLFAVELLQDVKRLFALPAVRNQSLAIVVVLHAGQESPRRMKIHKHPRGHACQGRYLLEHFDLSAEDLGLVLLGPT